MLHFFYFLNFIVELHAVNSLGTQMLIKELIESDYSIPSCSEVTKVIQVQRLTFET